MKTYVVTLIYPSPLIGTERHEVEAGSVELALAKAPLRRLTHTTRRPLSAPTGHFGERFRH
jgi:hypothetical protein